MLQKIKHWKLQDHTCWILLVKVIAHTRDFISFPSLPKAHKSHPTAISSYLRSCVYAPHFLLRSSLPHRYDLSEMVISKTLNHVFFEEIEYGYADTKGSFQILMWLQTYSSAYVFARCALKTKSLLLAHHTGKIVLLQYSLERVIWLCYFKVQLWKHSWVYPRSTSCHGFLIFPNW